MALGSPSESLADIQHGSFASTGRVYNQYGNNPFCPATVGIFYNRSVISDHYIAAITAPTIPLQCSANADK